MGVSAAREIIGSVLSTSLAIRLGAVIVTTVFVGGCGQISEGTATRTDDTLASSTSQAPQPPNGYAWLNSVMPTSKELTEAAGYQITIDEPPTVHPGPYLRDTVVGSRSLTNPECLGVVSPFEQRVYQGAPVVAITYATEAAVTFGAAALSSDAAARELFDLFAAQWQECLGKTLVKADGSGTFSDKITGIEVDGAVISAVIDLTSDSPTGIPVRVKRALGVANDCILEAEVGITEPPLDRTAPGSNGAADLVKSMLAKVDASRP